MSGGDGIDDVEGDEGRREEGVKERKREGVKLMRELGENHRCYIEIISNSASDDKTIDAIATPLVRVAECAEDKTDDPVPDR